MRAKLKRLHSPDISNLEAYEPADSEHFGFLLQMMVGPANSEGEESFDVVICTPRWLKSHYEAREAVPLCHHVLVFRYDYPRIEEALRTLVESCEARSWHEVAQKIGRFARWEFEDYRPTE